MLDTLNWSELKKPDSLYIADKISFSETVQYNNYVQYMQMINLFRDPECKSVVITLQDEPAQGTLSMVTVDNSTRSDVIDAMQKKIDEQDSYIKTLQQQIDLHAASNEAIHITSSMEVKVSDDTKCVDVLWVLDQDIQYRKKVNNIIDQ